MSRFCVRRKTEETLTAQKKKNSPEAHRQRVVQGILWNDDDHDNNPEGGPRNDDGHDHPWNSWQRSYPCELSKLLSSSSSTSSASARPPQFQWSQVSFSVLSSNTWNRDIWGDGSTKILLWVDGWVVLSSREGHQVGQSIDRRALIFPVSSSNQEQNPLPLQA